jgi:outer membrane protein OmpA-like peptidoglycan-associated protein
MSRLYDDLKGRSRDQKGIEELDLFAFASARKFEKAPPPPAAAAPPVVDALRAGSVNPEPASAVESPGSEPPPVTELPPEPVRSPVVQPSARTPYPMGQSPLLGVGRSMPRNRRRGPVLLAIALAVLGVVALGALLWGVVRWVRRPQPVTVLAAPNAGEKAVPKAVSKPVVKPPAKPAGKPVAARAASPSAPGPATSKPGRLDWSVAGAVVSTKDGESTVYFNNGVFGNSLELSPEGRAVLGRVAERMKPHAAELFVKVVGCTDNTPVAKKGRFKDNRELGLARAHVVVKYLQEVAGLPAESLAVQSYGAQWSPFPNDSPVSRAKNRTVVLRVSMRPGQRSQ